MTPTLLLILDGWGLTEKGEGNAPWVAATPHLDDLMARCPHSRLAASGREVGLPAGYMGNSEVGHLNIGAGRIVYQDMTRIDVALEDGSLFHNPVLQDMLERTRRSGGRLHLAGLLSDGGVHSHINHLVALCAMAFAAGVPVRIHCFMDGRDTPPQSGASYVRSLLEQIVSMKDVRVASLAGRFYAMDRDKRWERVRRAYDLLARPRMPCRLWKIPMPRASATNSSSPCCWKARMPPPCRTATACSSTISAPTACASFPRPS